MVDALPGSGQSLTPKHKAAWGLWIAETEGAKLWLPVSNETKNWGLQNVLIAVVDRLKGLPEAITAITAIVPKATAQTGLGPYRAEWTRSGTPFTLHRASWSAAR